MVKRYFGVLALVAALLVTGGTAFSQDAEKKAPQPAAQKGFQSTVFQGKLYSSLKRNVPIPYQGIVINLLVQAGQQVKRGEPVVEFQLAPQVIAQLRRSVAPKQIQDLDIRLVQLQKELAPLRAKYKEVLQLAKQNMASAQNKAQIASSIDALEKQRISLEQQVDIFRQSIADDKAALKSTLGEEISFDNIPNVVQLKAPIDGHVLWINPMIRNGAEMGQGAGLLIGVMDPMIIRANVFEIEASRLKVGNRAIATLASVPDKQFDAVVTRISWTPTPGTSDLNQPSYYEVELTAPNPAFVLKEGFKTEVKILQ